MLCDNLVLNIIICNVVAQKMYNIKFVHVSCPEGHAVWWCTTSSQIIRGIFKSHIISLSVAVLHAISTFVCPWDHCCNQMGVCIPNLKRIQVLPITAVENGRLKSREIVMSWLCSALYHSVLLHCLVVQLIICWISLTSIQQSTVSRNPLA